MSPNIAHFPADVLLEICLYAVQDQYFRMKHKSPPWNISRVCSHWRNVSLGYPRLWAKFRVVMTDSSYSHDALSAVLQRSRAHPLTFAFYIDKLGRRELALSFITKRPYPRNNPQVQYALQMIGAESHRWKSVLFSLPVVVLQSYLASPFITDVGMLEDLTLEKPISDEQEVKDPLPPINTFLAAHNLRHVTLKVDMVIHLPKSLQTFHAHYTHYHSLRYLVRIPSRCPNLKSFDAICDGMLYLPPLVSISGPMYTHMNLKHFSVQHDTFLCSLTLPAVEWLSVRVPQQTQGLLGSLLQRSQCHSLRYLNIAGVYSREFPHIVENASTVETLLLAIASPDPAELFRSLALNDHLLPRLNVLNLVMYAQGALPSRPKDEWLVAEVDTMATVMLAFLRNRMMVKVEIVVESMRDAYKHGIPRAKWPTGDLAILQGLRNSGLGLRLRMFEGHNYLT